MKTIALRLLVVILALVALPARADRVKDLANVGGVRENALVGYGLVVGLPGTGDQSTQAPFTIQTVSNMLSRFGIKVPDGVSPQLKNVAAVTVHANLPAFAKPGQSIDVTVSSMGNAGSLRGGTLLMAPMLGADGQVYAIAQGSLLVSGLGASGADGSKVTVNIPSSGRIPNGATVERPAPSSLSPDGIIALNLKHPDFTNAHNLVEVVNRQFGADTARAADASTVLVRGPVDMDQRVGFISLLEGLDVETAEPAARVVINSRTGTLVIGGHVRMLPAAVSHGSLTVTITERAQVSQPAPFSPKGETVVVPQSTITVDKDKASPESRMFLLETGVTLADIVKAINSVGAAPSDLVAILEALNQAGSLKAELIVI